MAFGVALTAALVFGIGLESGEHFEEALERMRSQVRRGRETLLDEYAAEDPGEFFAVMSEGFFAHPDELDDAYPQVYERLREFYRQDPLAWPEDG